MDYRVPADAKITIPISIVIYNDGSFHVLTPETNTEDENIKEINNEEITFKLPAYDVINGIIVDATVTPVQGQAYVSDQILTDLVLDTLLIGWSFTDSNGHNIIANWESAKDFPYEIIKWSVQQFWSQIMGIVGV